MRVPAVAAIRVTAWARVMLLLGRPACPAGAEPGHRTMTKKQLDAKMARWDRDFKLRQAAIDERREKDKGASTRRRHTPDCR